MKSINQIFRDNEHLMDLGPVEELIEYCRELEDEVVENNQVIKEAVKNLTKYISSYCIDNKIRL